RARNAKRAPAAKAEARGCAFRRSTPSHFLYAGAGGKKNSGANAPREREIITMRTQHKTPDDKLRAQAQAQRQIDANRREEQAARRNLFSHFRMWTVCPGKACMRARACRGDVERCLRERWHPLVPPRLKVLLQKASAFMANGMSPREAAAAA